MHSITWSHSSVGWSVWLITVRSAVQARVGPFCCWNVISDTNTTRTLRRQSACFCACITICQQRKCGGINDGCFNLNSRMSNTLIAGVFGSGLLHRILLDLISSPTPQSPISHIAILTLLITCLIGFILEAGTAPIRFCFGRNLI
jgi:hypothetical protein